MVPTTAFQFTTVFILFAYCNLFSINHLLQSNDADDGEQRADIPEINSAAGLSLFQGDILLPKQRSALISEHFRWNFPIPFIMADNLELNAKGVILKSFEAFHLKSCVHFKPHDGERSYIIFQKFLGCWSAVGDKKRGQNISVGVGCDHKAIVIHEILHALGFYHEQTRTDRDDYVKIQWDHVLPGQEHNFEKHGIETVTDLNTPYDYESIMHYGPFSFGKNSSLATMTTSLPEFNSIIGQRLDFSITDLERLNRMYNCTRSLTLLDQCDFESGKLCGLVQDPVGDAGWVHKKSSFMGQDHTYIQQCEDAGHFIYFNTSDGIRGDTAVLQSRIFYPKRKHQCLEFFFKMTGNLEDKLIVSVKKDDGTGNVRKLVKIKTFQGDQDHDWKIAHVNLKGQTPFRYLFHGLKGNPDDSSGGISIDDLTLSETKCPSAVWLIRNFSSLIKTAPEGYSMWSPRFYSPEGYGYGLALYPKGLRSAPLKNYTRISFHLTTGGNDDILEWPVLHRQVTITVLDQNPNVMERMSSERSFTTNETQVLSGTNCSRWRRPIDRNVDPSCNCSRSRGWGWNKFISHAQLRRRSYLKNDDLIVFAEFEDLTHLIRTEERFPRTWPLLHDDRKKRLAPLEGWQSQRCNPNPCQHDGICVNIKGNTSCRCASSKLFSYTGQRCEVALLRWSILGWWAAVAAGTNMLIIYVVCGGCSVPASWN